MPLFLHYWEVPLVATELQLELYHRLPLLDDPTAHWSTMKIGKRCSNCRTLVLSILAFLTLGFPAQAQESPYFITYDHYLEEPGSLEVEYFSNFATQRGGNDFHAYWLELEYGATA